MQCACIHRPEADRLDKPPDLLLRFVVVTSHEDHAPLSDWLAGPLRDFARDTLALPALDDWFQRREIDRLWDEPQSRRRDNGLRLFSLITLALWMQGLEQRS